MMIINRSTSPVIQESVYLPTARQAVRMCGSLRRQRSRKLLELRITRVLKLIAVLSTMRLRGNGSKHYFSARLLYIRSSGSTVFPSNNWIEYYPPSDLLLAPIE
jgi:hypothetical protein